MPDKFHNRKIDQAATPSLEGGSWHAPPMVEPVAGFAVKSNNILPQEGGEDYRSLYFNTPAMMHSIDREGRILRVSRCWLESLGYEESEVLGRKSVEFLTPESRIYAEEVVLPEYFKTGVCKDVPYQMVKRSGEIVDVLLSSIAERDAEGNVVRSLAVLTDVTAQKRTQEALSRSEEQAKAQYQGFPVPTYTWRRRQDGEFVLVEYNDAARVYTEGRIAGILGTTAGELYPDEPAIKEDIYRCHRQQCSIRREMLYQLRSTGEFKYLDVSYVFVPPDMVMIHCDDITERKLAEEALKKSKLELEQRVGERTASLEQSIKSLEGLLYHVAHDLRAPLRSMHSFTELLLEDYARGFDATGEKYAKIISEASAKMDFLIRDLLCFGRLGHQHVSWTSIDLAALLERVLAGLRRDGAGARAEIQMDGPLPKVWGDPHILEQVLVNLISNGFKFVAQGTVPRLRIWADAGPETVRLHIRDNGIGIAPEYHERIFRVFERLHPAETDYAGTGIGLAIVKKGMERLGGRVGVESSVGEGSCFWLELKAHAP